MPCMFVTLDVTQPDMSALKMSLHEAACVHMRSFMSVTAETSQDPIFPCVASAAAWSAQNSTSAAERVALVANIVADAVWAIASTPSRRQWPRGKAVLPVEWACVDGSRGFRVPLTSFCPAAVVDVGRSLVAAGGLDAGLAGMVWRAILGGVALVSVGPDGDQ